MNDEFTTNEPHDDDTSGGEPSARHAIVRAAIASVLTDKQREAIELFFFEGLSQSEIARRLGVSQQVVQKRIHGAQRDGIVVGGAIAKLREALVSRASELGIARASRVASAHGSSAVLR